MTPLTMNTYDGTWRNRGTVRPTNCLRHPAADVGHQYRGTWIGAPATARLLRRCSCASICKDAPAAAGSPPLCVRSSICGDGRWFAADAWVVDAPCLGGRRIADNCACVRHHFAQRLGHTRDTDDLRGHLLSAAG